ncbi:MAG: Hsp70 family protein [Planctomycetes bacterium]|nr:Hsp70 family protein [Planctomycetota bacterium]
MNVHGTFGCHLGAETCAAARLAGDDAPSWPTVTIANAVAWDDQRRVPMVGDEASGCRQAHALLPRALGHATSVVLGPDLHDRSRLLGLLFGELRGRLERAAGPATGSVLDRVAVAVAAGTCLDAAATIRAAAAHAGLHLLDLCPLPLAAVAWLEACEGRSAADVLVVHGDGGSMDAAVLRRTATQWQTLAVETEPFLGSIDFDRRFAGLLAARAGLAEGAWREDPSQLLRAAARLRLALAGPGDSLLVDGPLQGVESGTATAIARADCATATADLVERIGQRVAATLAAVATRSAGAPPPVVLLGGSLLAMPFVRAEIERRLAAAGGPFGVRDLPIDAVARGAAARASTFGPLVRSEDGRLRVHFVPRTAPVLDRAADGLKVTARIEQQAAARSPLTVQVHDGAGNELDEAEVRADGLFCIESETSVRLPLRLAIQDAEGVCAARIDWPFAGALLPRHVATSAPPFLPCSLSLRLDGQVLGALAAGSGLPATIEIRIGDRGALQLCAGERLLAMLPAIASGSVVRLHCDARFEFGIGLVAAGQQQPLSIESVPTRQDAGDGAWERTREADAGRFADSALLAQVRAPRAAVPPPPSGQVAGKRSDQDALPGATVFRLLAGGAE